MAEELQGSDIIKSSSEEEELQVAKPSKDEEEKERKRKEKIKKKLLKEVEKAKKKGVCYLSRIPPNMDPSNLRHNLSPYAQITRLYIVPRDPEARTRRRGFLGEEFSEGWVEFENKHVAKRVANMLNGEQIGGKKRSQFYYDIWNIKYLSKFKWHDLTEDTAYKNAIRKQKIQMELSAARREQDFYISKVEQSRAQSEIEKRMKKKRKVENVQKEDSENAKVIRHFPQNQVLVENVGKNKSKLSTDFLAEVFNTKNDKL